MQIRTLILNYYLLKFELTQYNNQKNKADIKSLFMIKLKNNTSDIAFSPSLDHFSIKGNILKQQSKARSIHPIEEFNEFHNGPTGLREMKKRLKNLTIQELTTFNENIQILKKFFSQKKKSEVRLTIMALEQFTNVINVYQSNPWPMNYTDQIIKKMRYCFQQIQEEVQILSQNINYGCVREVYESQLNPLLYLIIVLIAKAQKQKEQPYFFKKHLNRFLSKSIQTLLIELPLFYQEKNLKFYAVIIGYVGENFTDNERIKKPLYKRVFAVIEKLKHSKNLYYLLNFLREKVQDFSFNTYEVDSQTIIIKMKQLIKESFDNYQICTLLDIYNRMILDNYGNKSKFYDEEILNYTLDVSSGLGIKFPSNSYKLIYYGAARKYASYMINMQQFIETIGSEMYLNEKIVNFCEFLMVSSTNLEENTIFVEDIFYKIIFNSLLTLIQDGFIEVVLAFLKNCNYSIIISGLNILKTIVLKLSLYSYSIAQNVCVKIINEVQELCTEANQYAICQLAKEVQRQIKNMDSKNLQRL